MRAEIYNYSTWIDLVEPLKIKHTYEEILTACGFTIINYIEHNFTPFGYTGLWLLAESHFAVHTFPEEKKTYIELSSCNRDMYEMFILLLEKNGYQKKNCEFKVL